MAGRSAFRDTLGIEPPVGEGEDTHTLPYDPKLRGRTGFMHGGAIAGFLAEVCDARADAEGADHAAVTSSLDFVRGGREQTSYARSRIRARTARLLTIEATAWQESEDKPIAVMSRIYLRRAH